MTRMNTIFSQDLYVFGVGLPKTGLTSLARLMKTIGCDAGGREGQARRAFFIDQDYLKVLALYEMGRFFSDGPTCLMYKLIYEKYGRSGRFILTVRRDADTWFASLKRHNLYAGVKNKHRWIFGRFYPHGFDDELKAYYERHNAEVATYFAERGASDLLLTLCCDEADALQKALRLPRRRISCRRISKREREFRQPARPDQSSEEKLQSNCPNPLWGGRAAPRHQASPGGEAGRAAKPEAIGARRGDPSHFTGIRRCRARSAMLATAQTSGYSAAR